MTPADVMLIFVIVASIVILTWVHIDNKRKSTI